MNAEPAGNAAGAGAIAGLRVAVLVLGDLGRSPRMQYHALALADEGASVDLFGYRGHPPDRAVALHPRIHVHLLPAPLRQSAPRALFVPVALGDVAAQTAWLGWALLARTPGIDVLLVQNPPAFPTLPLGRIIARARGCRLVVDWHNFGADLLALRLPAAKRTLGLARAAERAWGRGADAHLCVSEAMASHLAEVWGIPGARVLRDRPANRVGPLSLVERQALFDRYEIDLQAASPDRPALVVTSSSWTADEDFSVLLDAMRSWDAGATRGSARLPRLLVVMTGAGPARSAWERRLAALRLSRVRARTLWLEAEDYPRLLAAADVGVCLHRSASGVDLPMKIADMFGAGLPVCALDYGPVLRELVRDGENGRLFATGDELARHLGALLEGFPDATPTLDALRQGVARTTTLSWAEGWRREAKPVFMPRPGRSGGW